MKFHNLVPMLYTTDLEATIAFYTNHLGFTCGEQNKDWDWAVLYRDDVELMFATPNEHINFVKPEFSGSFYMKISNVDTLWQTVKDEVEVCYAIDNFEWNMREFAIYDNNGYILQFGEELSLN